MRIRALLVALVAAVTIIWGSDADAQVITADRWVCAAANTTTGNDCGGASGTDYTTITAAVTAASAGETVCLKAGETFSEQVLLPNKGALASPITIRSCAGDGLLPTGGVRITPAYEAYLPVWKSPTINTHAVRTDSRAQDYIIKFIQFEGDPRYVYSPLRIGWDGADFRELQAQDVTVEQVIIKGHVTAGLRRGIALNGKNLVFKDSYLYNMNSFGADGQCVWVSQGEGPIYVQNNYCSGGTEPFLIGGSDPDMYTNVNTAAGSTTSALVYDTATFRTGHTEDAHAWGAMSDLVGKLIAVSVGTGTREHSYVSAVDTATNTITVSPALSTAPAAGLDLRWCVIPSGLYIERNHFTRPVGFDSPILGTPGSFTATADAAAGTRAAGTYDYLIKALGTGQDGNNADSSTATASVTRASTGSVLLSWTAVTNATSYRVYRKIINATTGAVSYEYWDRAAGVTSYLDTGTAGTSATSIAGADIPVLKTSFEIKYGKQIYVRANIFDYVKALDEATTSTGWFKSVNQSGGSECTETTGLYVEYNVWRHAPGGFLFSSSEEYLSGRENAPAPLRDVVFRHNLLYDIVATYNGTKGGLKHGLSISDYGSDGSMRDFTFEHNTVVGHPNGNHIYFTANPLRGTNIIRSNVFATSTGGIQGVAVGGNAASSGSTALANFNIGTFTHNAVAGVSSASYPANNQYPSITDMNTAFVNPTGANITDYTFDALHAYLTGAHDGTAIGADITALAAAVANVEAGTPPAPVLVMTTELTDGTINQAYTAFTLAASGGTGSFTWSHTGSLPAGMTLTSAGVLSGTPTASGTFNITVRATDTASAYDEQALSLVIAGAATPPIVISTTSLPNATRGTAYEARLVATGGSGAIVWSIASGSLPPGLTLSGDTISGTPTTVGAESFTVQATASVSGTRVLSITVTVATPTDGRPLVVNGQELYTFARDNCATLTSDADRPVRIRDLCVDINGVVWVVTDTEPTIEVTEVQGVAGSNEPHEVVTFFASPTATTASNAAALGTELFGGDLRQRLDLSRGYTEFRIRTYQAGAGATGAVTYLEYSLDNTTFAAIDGSTGGAIAADSTGYRTGTWTSLTAAAKADDVYLRMMVTGDGVADPSYRLVVVEFR